MEPAVTPTQLRVLQNLSTGKPMWEGVQVFNNGAGVPSVVTALLRRRLIQNNLVRGGFTVTPAGQEIVQAAALNIKS